MGPTLPEELVAQVVEHYRLPPARTIASRRAQEGRTPWGEHDEAVKCNLQTLSSLCQVSKAFGRIAEPVLYEVFPGESIIKSPRIWLAALTIKPYRMASVKELVFEDKPYRGDTEIGFPEPFNSEEEEANPEQLVDRLIARLANNPGDLRPNFMEPLEPFYVEGLPNILREVLRASSPYDQLSSTILCDLASGFSNGVLAAALMLLPNVVAIDLSWEAHVPGWIASVLCVIASTDTSTSDQQGVALRHFERLDLRSSTYDIQPGELYTSDAVFPLLRIPTLAFFGVHGKLFSISEFIREPPKLNTALRSIYVHNGSLPGLNLESILSFCPNVESFEFSADENGYDFDEAWSLQDLRPVLDAINAEGHNVKHLGFTPTYCHPPIGYSQELSTRNDEWGTGSLRGFESIETLDAVLWQLLGPSMGWDIDEPGRLHLDDMLPPNLRKLTLIWPRRGPEKKNSRTFLQENADMHVFELNRLFCGNQYPRLEFVRVTIGTAEGKPMPRTFTAPGWTEIVQASEDGEMLYTFTRTVSQEE